MKNQTIHCSVSSCRHHNTQNGCDLSAINVCANCNCHSGKSDESMCGSYECCLLYTSFSLSAALALFSCQ